MRFNRAIPAVLGALGLAAMSSSSFAAGTSTLLKKWDPDKDGTLDLAEVNKAALARFEQIDPDHDGSLDAKEVAKVGIGKKDLGKADPDHDATLDKDEYLAIVARRFKTADPDNDGTLDAKELKSKAGKALVQLM